VTEVDLLRCIVGGAHSVDAPVGSLVESDFTTVTPDTRIELLTGVLGDASFYIVETGTSRYAIHWAIDGEYLD
jgi:cystathionine beta-synthase